MKKRAKTCRTCDHCVLKMDLRQTNSSKEVVKELHCMYFDQVLKNDLICEKYQDHGREPLVFE